MCFSDCFSMFKEDLTHKIVIYAVFLAKIDQNISAKIPSKSPLRAIRTPNLAKFGHSQIENFEIFQNRSKPIPNTSKWSEMRSKTYF